MTPAVTPAFFTRATAIPTMRTANRGAGLTFSYGFFGSPFGEALVVACEKGIAAIGFREDDDDGTEALADITRRWPAGTFIEDRGSVADLARRAFDPATWDASRPLPLVLIGTAFDIAVWNRLLAIPFGAMVDYSTIAAELGKPSASRAVGSAVGRNPISFIVPCHRVIGRNGGLCGYHWGLPRKRKMLEWEQGLRGARQPDHSASLQPLLL